MRRFLSAVGAVALVATGASVPAAAYAASPPTVQWAHSVENDLGRIEVSVSAEGGVANIAVHVVSRTTHEDLAVVTDFHLISGDATQGIWESNSEVILPDLDDYPLDVVVTDNDGAQVEQHAAGILAYDVQMYYNDLHSTATVTYSRRDLIVSGQLLGRWPGTGAVAPVGNFPVELSTLYGDFIDGTTGTNGRFKLTSQIREADDFGSVTTVSDPNRPGYLQAYADIPSPTIKQAPTRLTEHLDHRSIVFGQTITASGDLSWKSPGGWEPVPDASMVLELCQPDQDPRYCGGILSTTTTDDHGHYSAVVTPNVGGDLVVGTYNADPFITTDTYKSVAVTVADTVRIENFVAVRDSDTGRVYVGGNLEFGFGTPVTASVAVQYSADGKGGWCTVATIDLSGNPEEKFGQEFDQPASGYWRVTYSGEPERFESATSPVVYVG